MNCPQHNPNPNSPHPAWPCHVATELSRNLIYASLLCMNLFCKKLQTGDGNNFYCKSTYFLLMAEENNQTHVDKCIRKKLIQVAWTYVYLANVWQPSVSTGRGKCSDCFYNGAWKLDTACSFQHKLALWQKICSQGWRYRCICFTVGMDTCIYLPHYLWYVHQGVNVYIDISSTW